MSKQTNLTVKGQVTIPKDVRDALGLKPGEPVEFDWNAAGEAVIRKGQGSAGEPQRQRDFEAAMRRISAVQAKYSYLQTGENTDDIMRDLRGDEPLP
jgi:AbrB family looped-hinge helix DNA binding protein